jgi:hypothetical protein
MTIDKQPVSEPSPGRTGAVHRASSKPLLAAIAIAIVASSPASRIARAEGARSGAGSVGQGNAGEARTSSSRKPKASKSSQDAPKDEPDGPPPSRESESLAKQARALFDAIAGDTPENALVFFFPREPFLVLKDVKDPGRYHDELVRAFRHDIHQLNGTRRSWEGARFVGFELGSPPKWIKPGVEWNKLGYYRTFDAKLRYEVSGKQKLLFVHTIISWDGKWYVTHLVRVKH